MSANNLKSNSATDYFNKSVQPLLEDRLAPSEALIEYILISSSDRDIYDRFTFLHDWFLAQKDNGFDKLAKYASQSQERLSEAISLFVKKRGDLCCLNQEDINESAAPYKLLQLYLLYDCLLHVGAKDHDEEGIHFLDDKAAQSASTDLTDITKLSQKRGFSSIYNYVLHSGELIIGSKGIHHSELAMGKPVEAAGEICALKTKDGSINFFVNHRSGHYRPLDSCIEQACKALANQLHDLSGLDNFSITGTVRELHDLPEYLEARSRCELPSTRNKDHYAPSP